MSDVYSLRLRKLAHSVAKDEGLSHFIREGVYLMASGPSYETPAELRFFRTIGADVVGTYRAWPPSKPFVSHECLYPLAFHQI